MANGFMRPNCLTVWFAENEQVGLDVRWTGSAGARKAAATQHRFRSAGHPTSLIHDELGCTVRLGPIDQFAVDEIVGRFLGAR